MRRFYRLFHSLFFRFFFFFEIANTLLCCSREILDGAICYIVYLPCLSSLVAVFASLSHSFTPSISVSISFCLARRRKLYFLFVVCCARESNPLWLFFWGGLGVLTRLLKKQKWSSVGLSRRGKGQVLCLCCCCCCRCLWLFGGSLHMCCTRHSSISPRVERQRELFLEKSSFWQQQQQQQEQSALQVFCMFQFQRVSLSVCFFSSFSVSFSRATNCRLT